MRCGLSPRCARGICCIRGLGRGSASQAKWEAEKQPIQRRGAELLPRTVGNLRRMPPRMRGMAAWKATLRCIDEESTGYGGVSGEKTKNKIDGGAAFRWSPGGREIVPRAAI